MKCQKICYMSPLIGSVECEELLKDTHGSVDISSEGVSQLYHRQFEIEQFLENHCEDLTQHLPEELGRLVVKAVFGKYHEERCRAYLVTEIYTRVEPTEEQEEAIREWIAGQLSDGWGEGLQNTPAFEEEVDKYSTEFDPYMCSFEEECYAVDAYYYLSAYSDDFELIRMMPTEEVELDVPILLPIVAAASSRLQESGIYTTRTVYRLENKDAVVEYIKNSGVLYSDEFIQFVEKLFEFSPEHKYYIVCQNEGTLTKFLPVLGIMYLEKHESEIFNVEAETGEVNSYKFKECESINFYSYLMEK